MKNLGKLYLLLIVTATFLQAGVTAKVEPEYFIVEIVLVTS